MVFDPDWKEKEDIIKTKWKSSHPIWEQNDIFVNEEAPKTIVVNIHKDKYDVYIGRAGKGQDGYFGNLHNQGNIYCPHCKGHHDRIEAIALFKKEFLERIEKDQAFRKRVLELKGKRLGCFCKQPTHEVACHGDVYVEWLEKNA